MFSESKLGGAGGGRGRGGGTIILSPCQGLFQAAHLLLLLLVVVVVVVLVVVVMDLAVSGNMLAAIRAVEELPVEQLDGDHSKYELLGEEMIELNNFKFQLKLL